MTTPKLHPDLNAFLLCLVHHRVRFVVIGAHALALLGRPRYTDDLDILIEPTPANAKRLAEAVRQFGYEALASEVPRHLAREERMITLGRAPVAIDILSSTTGLRFEEAWSGRTSVLINGHRIGFLGLREYVKTKRACGRPKDLLDLELLREAGLLRTFKVRKPTVKRARSRTKAVTRADQQVRPKAAKTNARTKTSSRRRKK